MINALRTTQFNDIYVSNDFSSTASTTTAPNNLDDMPPHHNSRSHLYHTAFGLTATEINIALNSLLSDAENKSIHQRTFAYDILRYVPRSNLKIWQQISTAIMQDFSAAEHLDHTISALEIFESLPDQILLQITTDYNIDGKMISILEHQSPEIRCIAVRRLSGAWLRVWLSLENGELKKMLQIYDEENENEGIVRQHTSDRAVLVWKAIIALCTSDDDDAVSAAAFRAMEMLFDAGCLSSDLQQQQQQMPPPPFARDLALRVFKAMGGRVYSLAARIRSLSGTYLAQSILGMTSLYSFAICSGVTVRVEGSARDIDPSKLAEMFVQTILLPKLGDVNIEIQIVTAMSIQRLSENLGSPTLQKQWMLSVSHHIAPSIVIAHFDALDSMIKILIKTMKYTPINDVIETYILLCCISVRIKILKTRQKMLKTISNILVNQIMEMEVKEYHQMVQSLLNTDWMRYVILGDNDISNFGVGGGGGISGSINGGINSINGSNDVNVAVANTSKCVRHEVLYYLLFAVQQLHANQHNRSKSRGFVGIFLRACAPCLCWLEEDISTNEIDAANGYLSLLTEVCKVQREQEIMNSPSTLNTNNENNQIKPIIVDDENMEEDMEGDEEKENENSLQNILDDIFEWHLPNVFSSKTRIHLIRLLSSSWSCDNDPGDADKFVSIIHDELFQTKSSQLRPSSFNDGNNRRMKTGDSMTSSNGVGKMITGDSTTESSNWTLVDGISLGESRRRISNRMTIVEYSRVLLPSVAMFAARNSVAFNSVNALLKKTASVRNNIVRSLSKKTKEWLVRQPPSANKMIYTVPSFSPASMLFALEHEQKEQPQEETTTQVAYRTLTGTGDPLQVDAFHIMKKAIGTAEDGVPSICLCLRILNLTNISLNNIRIKICTNGPIIEFNGSSIGHLFEGKLPPGGMVEWRTTDYVSHCFGPFSFNIIVAIPNAVPSSDEQEWPEEEDDLMEMTQQIYQNSQRQTLIFECSPYDIEIQDLLRPVYMSLDIFNTLWTTSDHHFTIDGLLNYDIEQFTKSFSSHFAIQLKQDESIEKDAKERTIFRSTSYVSKSFMDKSLLCMNISTSKNMDQSFSIRFEFRSKNIDVIHQMKIHMKQQVWFRIQKHNMTFINGRHSSSANSNLQQETLERAKEWLGM